MSKLQVPGSWYKITSLTELFIRIKEKKSYPFNLLTKGKSDLTMLVDADLSAYICALSHLFFLKLQLFQMHILMTAFVIFIKIFLKKYPQCSSNKPGSF